MQEDCLIINDVPTKILQWGKTVRDNFDDNEQLIVVIPGNPGITEFYIEFLKELHCVTQISVWILSHAGHEIVPSQNMPPRSGNQSLFSLQGQIRHKEWFIENHVLTKGINFYLIGHSIGAYIILELLKNSMIKSRVLHNYLLFPTIEYMAETPNGVFIMNFLRYLKFLLIPLVYLVFFLPRFIKKFIISIYIWLTDIPDRFSDIIIDFVHPYTIQNFCEMGMDEMHEVRERNRSVLMENLSKIKLYYGSCDSWVPISYYGKLKSDIPKIDAVMCQRNYRHAFVLYDSAPMAKLVADWISEELIKNK